MPYFKVNGSSIYDRLHGPEFHLVVFNDGENSIPEIAGELIKAWPGQIDSTIIDLDAEIANIFASAGSFYVLLRPDNYIALISDRFVADDLRNYFNSFQ